MVKEMKHTSGETRLYSKGTPITRPFKEYLEICMKTDEIVITFKARDSHKLKHFAKRHNKLTRLLKSAAIKLALLFFLTRTLALNTTSILHFYKGRESCRYIYILTSL